MKKKPDNLSAQILATSNECWNCGQRFGNEEKCPHCGEENEDFVRQLFKPDLFKAYKDMKKGRSRAVDN